MSDQKQHIDQLFKQALSEHTVSPPDGVWENIAAHLSQQRKKSLVIIKWSIAAGVALLIGLGGYVQLRFRTAESKMKSSVVTNRPGPWNEYPGKTVSRRIAGSGKVLNTKAGAQESGLSVGKVPGKQQEKRADAAVAPDYAVVVPVLKRHDGNLPVGTYETSHPVREKRLLPVEIRFPLRESQLLSDIDLSAFAEQNTAKARPAKTPFHDQRPWHFRGQFAPLYAYRSIGSQAGSAGNFNNSESGLISYALVFSASYHFRPRWFLQMGVGYSLLGYSSSDVSVSRGIITTSDMSYVNKSGTVPHYYIVNSSAYSVNQLEEGSNTVAATAKPQSTGTMSLLTSAAGNGFQKVNGSFLFHMHYINVPLQLKYRLYQGKIDLDLEGGLGCNILISSDGVIETSGGAAIPVTHGASLHRFNFSSSAGVGIQYHVPGNFNLVVEPSFTYFINSATTSNIRIHPYAFGVYTGVEIPL